VDESWRCTMANIVSSCWGPVPYPLPGFDQKQCGWKSHPNCPYLNLWKKSLCGFWVPDYITYDSYVNVGWFGIMKPIPQNGQVDRLIPRLIYGKLQLLWKEPITDHFFIPIWFEPFMIALCVIFILSFCLYITRSDFLRNNILIQKFTYSTSAASAMASPKTTYGSLSETTPLLSREIKAETNTDNENVDTNAHVETNDNVDANVNTFPSPSKIRERIKYQTISMRVGEDDSSESDIQVQENELDLSQESKETSDIDSASE
jgi:hypothetical protein